MALPLGSGEAAGEPLADGVGTWTLPQPATTSATSTTNRARDLILMLRGIHAVALRRSTHGLGRGLSPTPACVVTISLALDQQPGSLKLAMRVCQPAVLDA